MGDRIKFGPLWLRNYSREASAGAGGSSSSGGQAGGGAIATASTASGSQGRSGASVSSANSVPSTSTSNQQQKSTIQLAKMRYGREEMLALYEKSVEAPNELKQFELLYNAREKPPIALNAFDDDGRGGGGAPIASPSGGDRYAGVGRGTPSPDTRTRLRQFIRPTAGRNPDERERPGEENPYDPSRERNYSRSRWQGGSPQQSWRRQASREESDEWRAAETTRPRSIHPDREWGDRSERAERGGRETKSWSTNRRTWVGDTPGHDDLPEWAEEGSLACGGTFDASGAFHGYSNDDTSIPKAQGDSSYQLIRSHTQGSFSRPKTIEEGSEEWWASEKAKKLSPKKFDANENKYKKQLSLPGMSTASDPKPTEALTKKEASPPQEPDPPKPESRFPKPEPEEKHRFAMMMKRMETMRKESSEERGNFKSVMINANNGLRQKHQNLVAAVAEEAARPQPAATVPAQAVITPAPHNSEQGRADKTQKNFESVDSFPASTLSDLTATHLNLHDIDFDDYFAASEAGSGGSTASSATSFNSLRVLNPNMGRMPLPERQTPVSQPAGVRLSGPPMMTATTPPLGMRLGLEIPRHMQPRKTLPYAPRLLYSGQPSPGSAGARESPSNQPASVNASASASAPAPASAYSPTMGPRMTSSLFMGPEGSIPMPGDIQNIQSQQPPSNQTSMFPGQGMQSAWRDDKIPMPGDMQNLQGKMHSQPPPSSQGALFGGQGMPPQPPPPPPQQQFASSMYGSMLQQPPLPLPPGLSDMWYYEDPKQITQGPFSSKEMYNWYRAGFFTSELMVRRACDLHMRPLGSYGNSVPFAPPDVTFQIPRSGFPGGHPDMHRFGLGDVMGGIGGPPESDTLQFGNVARDFIQPPFNQQPTNEQIEFGTVRRADFVRPPFNPKQPMVESLWSQPATPGAGDMWMPQQQAQQQQQQPQQQSLNSNDPRVMFFWDQQSTGATTGTILPDGKEMKTEDQILAQLRASQEAENATFLTKEAAKPELSAPSQHGATPDFGELEKLIQKEALSTPTPAETKPDPPSTAQPTPTKSKPDLSEDSSNNANAKSSQAQLKAAAEKLPKILKTEDKPKSKENGTAKGKKKNKEEKKDEAADAKREEEISKTGRKSEDSSPSKSKKEDKLSKKDLEKEKKEWLKEGFTIVKGSEKNISKESKKKAEEIKTAEEAERKRKEEEKQAGEEEKKRKQTETARKQQDHQPQQQTRQALEAVTKKAPWSAVSPPGPQGPSHEGLSLAEIQRLEREKKLEQMREQQAMMQLLAQQQQASLAREQEMQAGLGWAKKNASSTMPGQSLAEIQAEARKQAAASAAAAAAAAAAQAQVLEETSAPPPPVALNLPWGSTLNGGGFWDTERTNQIVHKAVEKPQSQPEAPKPEPKPKKKAAAPAPAASAQMPKKVKSPAHEFEAWCNSFLDVFSSKIDVPTFVGFLKDIESPFEVKEYVKCYLGESKDSNDFARQFLERRSKLLRAGTVTPVDDLCSPAAAINPRSAAGLDFQEGKAKKTKKNKMLKVDARILGFSVTASEDRINVGDIDSV